MTKYCQIIFSGTLFLPNIFHLKLFWGFSDAWFAQNKLLTELNSPISAVHFSFATTFQYLNFVRFWSYSKHSFFHRFSLQRWKPLVDIFFSSSRSKEANIGEHLKNSSNFEQRERKYANTWDGGGRASCQKSLQKHLFCVVFVFMTFCFHSFFQNNFRFKLSTIFNFQNAVKSPNLFVLKGSFHWWKPFYSIYNSLWENGR